MAAIQIFFCPHSNASCADFNVDKRLFKLPPFMHRVYGLWISVRGALLDRSASIFLFSVGVAKAFGMWGGGGGVEAMMKMS